MKYFGIRSMAFLLPAQGLENHSLQDVGDLIGVNYALDV